MTDQRPGNLPDREMAAWLARVGHSHNEFSSRELTLMFAAWQAGGVAAHGSDPQIPLPPREAPPGTTTAKPGSQAAADMDCALREHRCRGAS